MICYIALSEFEVLIDVRIEKTKAVVEKLVWACYFWKLVEFEGRCLRSGVHWHSSQSAVASQFSFLDDRQSQWLMMMMITAFGATNVPAANNKWN